MPKGYVVIGGPVSTAAPAALPAPNCPLRPILARGAALDESPERVALIQRLTWAYLRDALGLKDAVWPAPVESTLGRFESTP